MKYIFLFFVLISFSLKSCAQDSIYSCEKINNVIIDSTIFEQLPNKSFIINVNVSKKNIYIIETRKVNYYVSEVLMKDIKKSIVQSNCKDVSIKKLKKEDYKEIKIIREKN